MMIAEELLLLLTDDGSGRVLSGYLDYGLAGAVLADLALMGRVRLTEKGEPGAANRLVVVDDSPTDNPIFDDALDRLRGKHRKSQGVLRLYRHVRRPLQQRLVDAGVLRPAVRRVLGFAHTRYLLINPDPELDARIRLDKVLAEGADPDPRTAALIGCLSALRATHRVVRRGDRRAMNRRARELRQQYWPAETAYRVIIQAQAQQTAAATS